MTDELLEKLGTVYCYYTNNNNKSEITFEQFVKAYERGDDISGIISVIKERT